MPWRCAAFIWGSLLPLSGSDDNDKERVSVQHKVGLSTETLSQSNYTFSSQLSIDSKTLMCEWKAAVSLMSGRNSSRIDSGSGNEPCSAILWSTWCQRVQLTGPCKVKEGGFLYIGYLSTYSGMHYAWADPLWANSWNCRSFVSRPPDWKLLQSTAGVPRHASAQNKWRQKLTAVNTYERLKTCSNYQRSAWSISDHYSVISVGGCKVVLTPHVIDRMDRLWAEFQLAHKRKSYFSWQVEEFQSDSLCSCLLLVWTSHVP